MEKLLCIYIKDIHIYVLLNFGQYPCSIKEVIPMCPIAHVPHFPRCPISTYSINQDTPLLMCPIAHVSYCLCVKKMSNCQKDVKLSKRCQVVKNMLNIKKSNTWTMEEVPKKK